MKRVLMILTAVVVALTMTSCKKTAVLTADDFVDVSLEGLNGTGRVKILQDEQSISAKLDEMLFADEQNAVELLRLKELVLTSVKLDITGDTSKLSNGDIVIVTLNVDSEPLKEHGISFETTEYVYTVQGLAEPEELDVWSGLSVTYEGVEPNGKARVQYNGDNNVVKNNVQFSFPTAEGLSNGDVIRISASCRREHLEANGYILTDDSREFTVSGLSEYLKTNTGYELSQVDEMLKEKAQEVADGSSYNTDSSVYSAKLVPSGNLSEKWTVKEIKLTPDKKMFLYNEDTNRNVYAVYWNMNITAEKTGDSAYADDGYAKGDTDTFDVYILACITDLIADADGNIEAQWSNVSTTAYGNTLWGNYIGVSVDELSEYLCDDYKGYKATE